jgi:hypothetical protein
VPTEAERQRWLIALFGLGLLALATRLVAAAAVWSLPSSYLLNADSAQYHHFALVLAGLARGSLPEIFGLSPLATVWGALWHAILGPSVQALIGPQALILGVGTTLLVAASARRLGGPAAGIVAGALTAVCEPLVLYDCAVLATPLAVFLSAATLWSTLHAAHRPSLARCAILGLVIGASIACRPNSALFVPVALAIVAAAPAVPPVRARLARAAALVVATAIPVLPFTVANAVRSGAFVPVTASAGINLFIGNNQGATGRLQSVFGEHSAIDSFAVFDSRAEQVVGRPLDASEVSAFWTEKTAQEIADDPGRFAALIGKKLVYGLNDFEAPDSWSIPFLETELPPLISWLPGFGVLFALGLLGLIISWRRGPPGRRGIHGICAAALATMLIFFVAGRYRAPMLPALAAAAGIAAIWIADRVATLRSRHKISERRRAAASLAGAGLLIAAAINLAELPILESRDDIELERLARAFARDNRPAEALDRLERLRRLALDRGDTKLAERASRGIEAILPMTLKNREE